MRGLVLGECSQVITRLARERGHEFWSCDLKPAELEPSWHYQESWDDWINWRLGQFNVVIWHPECTALTVAGNWVYAAGKSRHVERLEAMEYVRLRWCLIRANSSCAVLENPRGVLGKAIGPYGCSVQPYEFGDDASKTTDLWTWQLPPLKKDPAKRLSGRWVADPKTGKLVERWSNQTDSGQNRLGPSATRKAERAETYPGIADAIISQWCSE